MVRLRILLAGISDLLSVDIPLGTIFSSYQTAVDHVEVRDGIESDFQIENKYGERGCCG